MNILCINHYAGSPRLGMEYRPYHLAREWQRAGHRVQIVAASFSHVRAHQPTVGRSAGDEIIDGVSYRWIPTPRYQGNGVARAWNIACFLRGIWRASSQLAHDFGPDVVIASSTYPMDIWAARHLAALSRAKLVFEVHDLWPLSPIELNGMSRWHPFVRVCQWAEDTAYRDADVVVSMLPKVHQHMAAHGLDLRRLAIVPNGVATEDWAQAPEALRSNVADAMAALRAQGRTVVGYAGSMGMPNALDVLLDAAAAMRSEPFGFVLVGTGHERERLLQRVVSENLSQVMILEPIPKAQVRSFLDAIDIAYIGWRHAPIYRFGIAPNKLMDYMMAGCCVLHSVQAGNDPVAESGCGLTVPPESPAAVARGLRELAALPPARRLAMGLRGREFVLAHHSYAVLAHRFIQAIESNEHRRAA